MPGNGGVGLELPAQRPSVPVVPEMPTPPWAVAVAPPEAPSAQLEPASPLPVAEAVPGIDSSRAEEPTLLSEMPLSPPEPQPVVGVASESDAARPVEAVLPAVAVPEASPAESPLPADLEAALAALREGRPSPTRSST